MPRSTVVPVLPQGPLVAELADPVALGTATAVIRPAILVVPALGAAPAELKAFVGEVPVAAEIEPAALLVLSDLTVALAEPGAPVVPAAVVTEPAALAAVRLPAVLIGLALHVEAVVVVEKILDP